MTIRLRLDAVLNDMAEDRLRQLLKYAEFLTLRDEYEAWHEFGRQQFARIYDGDESDYSLEDVKQARASL
jgi:hypothetical protein